MDVFTLFVLSKQQSKTKCARSYVKSKFLLFNNWISEYFINYFKVLKT